MVYLDTKTQDVSIEAIIPTYDENNNDICKVVYSNGVCKTTTHNISHFIMELLYAHKIHFFTQRMWSEELLGQRGPNPIIINEAIALVPFLARKSIDPQDACYGYIVHSSITDVHQGRVLLHSQVEVPYLSPMAALHAKILDANALLYVYRQDLLMENEPYAN